VVAPLEIPCPAAETSPKSAEAVASYDTGSHNENEAADDDKTDH
jgi:hypothetical protein